MKEYGIPGMAVAIVKNGTVVKMSTYGMANIEWQEPVTTHTNFQIASCTKLLTSTLITKTISNGKLSLNDHLGKFIDSIPQSWKSMTVKYLLNHSSGIKNF